MENQKEMNSDLGSRFVRIKCRKPFLFMPNSKKKRDSNIWLYEDKKIIVNIIPVQEKGNFNIVRVEKKNSLPPELGVLLVFRKRLENYLSRMIKSSAKGRGMD